VPRLDGVRSLEVVLTASCNLRCRYCFQDRRSRGRMEWPTLRGAVDLLVASPCPQPTLSFYGGEPLLAFDLLRRAVEHARARAAPGREPRFELFTNGLLLDREKAAFLAQHRVRTQISHDGVAPAQALRGPGTFERLDELLERLRQEQPGYWCELVELGLTLSGANLPMLADSVDYFLSRGARTVRLAPLLTPDPDWDDGSPAELDRQLARVFRTSLLLQRLSGEVPFAPFRRERRGPAAQPPFGWMCAAARGDALTVDVDGSVTGCVLLALSYQTPARLGGLPARLSLGHVTRLDLARRLPSYRRVLRHHGAFSDKHRKRTGHARCASCSFARECFVCPASIAFAGSAAGPRRIPDRLCAFNRVTLGYRRRFPSPAAAAAGVTVL
jgi:sulfatase maturation enzyme AslB (radical SAM superfamily)